MQNHRSTRLAHRPPEAVSDISPATGLTHDQVMTASEIADLLQLPVSTMYYFARRGELPARRLGRTWRFLRSRVEEMLGA